MPKKILELHKCNQCGKYLTHRQTSRLINRAYAHNLGFCSSECATLYQNAHRPKKKTRQHICPVCNIIFERINWKKSKFCSRTCNTIANNKRKDPKKAICVRCEAEITIDLHQHYASALCLTCSLSDSIRMYRSKCKFRFNLKDYPLDFDINLLESNGWYNKLNNKNGVSRDHLYSVNDGYMNRVDFRLLSHPANCNLILHKENRNKGEKSSISIEGLKERISKWESTHRG